MGADQTSVANGRRLLRRTIIASIDEPGEAEAAEEWIAAMSDRLAHVSEQRGCGCCVLIWDVEGPEEVIRTIPEYLRGYSDWDPAPQPRGLLQWVRRAFRR